jgi:S1-C subfamily serine protease
VRFDIGGSPALELRSENGAYQLVSDYTALQQVVLPVVSWEDEALHCWGTAFVVGGFGWALTARHVVEQFMEQRADETLEGTAGLFVLWETDRQLSGRPAGDALGGPLPVVAVDRHADSDIALLTFQLPEVTGRADFLPSVSLDARMPSEGEELVALGYPQMTLEGHVPPSAAVSVGYERALAVSHGSVRQRHPVRRDSAMICFPAVRVDSRFESGMSGGPVIDGAGHVIGLVSSSLPPDEEASEWASYVCLIGPALQLSGLARRKEADEITEHSLAQLVEAQIIDFDMDDLVITPGDGGRAVVTYAGDAGDL